MTLLELADELEKRAESEREIAANSERVAELLAPELAKFEADGKACLVTKTPKTWNTYAVRMAVDHKNSAKRDAAFADVLAEAAAALRTRSIQEGDTHDDRAKLEERIRELEAALQNTACLHDWRWLDGDKGFVTVRCSKCMMEHVVKYADRSTDR